MESAYILLQAVPSHIDIEKLKQKIEVTKYKQIFFKGKLFQSQVFVNRTMSVAF